MVQPRTWIPILQGAERQQAIIVAQETATVIERLSCDDAVINPTLAQGAAGWAVLMAYSGGTHAADKVKERAQVCWQLLERAVERVGSITIGPSLHGGFTGVAWAVEAVEHLSRSFPAAISMIRRQIRRLTRCSLSW
jgi:hypothetical protein